MNSQLLLQLKGDEAMHSPCESVPENQLDFKNASGKEILNYLDKFE